MLDRQTEIIAHFIGAFNQTTEKLAARQDYDAFRAHQLADAEQGPLLNVNVSISSDYALDGFTPGLGLEMPPPTAPEAPWLPVVEDLARIAEELPLNGSAPFYAEEVEVPDVPIPPEFFLTLPAPSSVLHVTSQINTLLDRDVLANRSFEITQELFDRFGPEASATQLIALAGVADELTVAVTPFGASAAEQADILMAQIDALDPNALPEGASASLFRTETIQQLPDPPADDGEEEMSEEGGETEAEGAEEPLILVSPLPPAFSGKAVIDGVIADEKPETLKERLDARDGTDDEAEAEDAPTPGRVEVEDGPAGTVSGEVAEPGPLEHAQSLETGDNLLLNQMQAVHDWIDAPVIAVAGTATSLSVISQVNVMQDVDHNPGHSGGGNSAHAHAAHGPEFDPASLAQNIAIFENQSNPVEIAEITLPAGAPGIIMTHVMGDLGVDNHITQINAVSDSDLVSYSFGAFSAEITMGGNSAVNFEMLLEIGAHFDVILVGGNLIEIAQIEQINVLLDDDLIMGNGPGNAPPWAASHDNLLWNEATLTKVGIDAQVEMSARFQATLDALAEIDAGRDPFDPNADYSIPESDAYDAAEGLFGDPLLAGHEALRVLWVEGDLIIRDSFTQINLLDDADMISVDGPDGLGIEAGDNILANAAGLTVAGVDSVIMAAGGVYSDAVIWQAGMISDEPMPGDLGGITGDLASEAVVFLAEGLLENAPSYDDENFQLAPATDGGSGSLDALNSVLA